MIIGLCGRKRSGKGTTAELLVKELGFKRVAFADKLKDLAARLVGVSLEEARTDTFKDKLIFGGVDGPDWEGRDVLQRLGVAACETFGKNFWVERAVRGPGLLPADLSMSYLFSWARKSPLVFTDVRFWNELEALRGVGALIVRLNRVDRQGQHVFELERALNPTHTQRLSENGRPVCFKCYLPAASHPTHFSGDTHASETTLPDSGDCYDLVVEGSSAEETAAKVLAWVKEKIDGK